MQRPGLEPESPAWQAGILAIELSLRNSQLNEIPFIKIS